MKDLTLKNGQTAVFLNVDSWGRPVYKLDKSGVRACCVNLNGTYLHTICGDGEPDCPLNEDYQPVS
jgi:hypothetical protein